jgi:hypothetical protein
MDRFDEPELAYKRLVLKVPKKDEEAARLAARLAVPGVSLPVVEKPLIYGDRADMHRKDWIEGATSQQIKVWAHLEYSKLIDWAIEYRTGLVAGSLEDELDTTWRKARVYVKYLKV